jgi:hypothetical protein
MPRLRDRRVPLAVKVAVKVAVKEGSVAFCIEGAFGSSGDDRPSW